MAVGVVRCLPLGRGGFAESVRAARPGIGGDHGTRMTHPAQAGDLLALLDALPAWPLFWTRGAGSSLVGRRRTKTALPGRTLPSLEEVIPQPTGGLLLEAARRCRSGGEPITVATAWDHPTGFTRTRRGSCPAEDGSASSAWSAPDATFLEELRKSEERFRLAFMTSPDAIAINRASNGKYVAINEGFSELLGWQEHEVLGPDVPRAGHLGCPEERAALMADLGRGGRAKIEGRFRRKNGDIGIGLLSAALFDLGGAPTSSR